MLGKIIMLAVAPLSSLATPTPEVIARLMDYNPVAQVIETPAGRSISFCRLTDVRLGVEDPVTKSPGFVQARVYESRSGGDRSVILLPPTGGENILDQGYANHLCAAGFRVFLLQTWHQQTETKLDMGMHDEGAVRSLSAIRHALDYLKPVRNSQVGILGTSVGALSSSLALGFDARLSAGVLIVGGVNMAEVIAASTEAGSTKLREARMKAFGYKTFAEYLSAMRAHVLIDPADFADFSGEKKVLAFLGANDVTVPTANQRGLVKAFHAEADEFEGDHVQTILNTFTWKRAKISAFFERNLR